LAGGDRAHSVPKRWFTEGDNGHSRTAPGPPDRDAWVLAQGFRFSLEKWRDNLPDPGLRRWGTSHYAQYLSLGHDWAREWKTNPDVIERVLFSVGKVSKTSPLVISIFTGLPLDR
jgi:hypothetical protein